MSNVTEVNSAQNVWSAPRICNARSSLINDSQPSQVFPCINIVFGSESVKPESC